VEAPEISTSAIDKKVKRENGGLVGGEGRREKVRANTTSKPCLVNKDKQRQARRKGTTKSRQGIIQRNGGKEWYKQRQARIGANKGREEQVKQKAGKNRYNQRHARKGATKGRQGNVQPRAGKETYNQNKAGKKTYNKRQARIGTTKGTQGKVQPRAGKEIYKHRASIHKQTKDKASGGGWGQ
jgi:hypothetical protein